MKRSNVISRMDAKTQKRLLWAIAALLVMAVIFVFSSQASFASEEASDAFADLLSMEQKDLATRVSNQSILFGLTLRKLAHIFLFAALGFSLYQALAGLKRRWLIAVGAGYLYGVLDEIHQSMSGRYGRWQDTLIDLIGVALGLAAALLLPKLNALCKKWFYENWDDKHPVAKRRLEWCLDALSLAAVMQYVGYRFLQTTMFEFIYSERYKTLTFLSLVVFGGVRFLYYFTRKLWADADEKSQIWRFLKFVGACCLALPFFIVAYLHDYKVLIFIPICWMCLYDIQAELVFKWYVRVIGIMLGATVLCCLAGVVKNINTNYDGVFKASYGIINTTDFAAYLLFLSIYTWCVQKSRHYVNSCIYAALFILVAVGVYYLTKSRTTLICLTLLVLSCLFATVLRKHISVDGANKQLYRILCFLSTITFPVFIVVVAALTAWYGQGSLLADRIDSILSSRLEDTWNTYMQHGIHLFGSQFIMHGLGGSFLHDWRNYDFLDVGYAQLMIRFGVFITAVMAYLWMKAGKKAQKNNSIEIIFVVLITNIYTLSESHFVDVNYNIMLVMPFCLFTGFSNENQTTILNAQSVKILHKQKWLSVLSVVVVCGIAYVILPSIITTLRTFYYLYHWNSGMNTLYAFVFSVSIIVWFYIVSKTLMQIHNKTKRRLVVLSAITILAYAGITHLLINNKINRGLSEYNTEYSKEKPCLERIMDAAEQPVYAVERGAIYKQEFSGITERIMAAEDILRFKEGSILTDKSRELPVITQYGGQYIEFSDTSGIYTFDPSVVTALASAGYEWQSFYSSERTCDLNDLAQLNNLQINEHGSIMLSGSNNSLNANRYIDQWYGAYEVRYTLSQDERPLATGDDTLICTLRVMGYKGEKIMLEEEVHQSEFDGDGHCVIVLPYSIPDTPRTEYLVIAADGVTLYVDEIAWRRVA